MSISNHLKIHLLDCKREVDYQANRIHESFHYKLNAVIRSEKTMKRLILINEFKMIVSFDKAYLSQHRNDAVMVHQMRISNKLSNIRRCPDRYRMHIHSPVTTVELLNTNKKN